MSVMVCLAQKTHGFIMSHVATRKMEPMHRGLQADGPGTEAQGSIHVTYWTLTETQVLSKVDTGGIKIPN